MHDDGSSRPSTRARGRAVEAWVARRLEDAGLSVLETNVEIGGAELDIVARDARGSEDTIVFVEVRSRSSHEHGTAYETVDRAKQRQIIRAATAWLVRNELWERIAVRFDVVAVDLSDPSQPRWAWFDDAFQVE